MTASKVSGGESQGLTRRQALKRVGVGAALVWSVPVVSMLSATPAHADELSTDVGGVKHPGGTGTEVLGTKTGSLAATGSNLPIAGIAAAGAAAVVAGGAAIAASRQRGEIED
ncbi:MAG: hypothetical protein QOJ49_607 [Actinomycetota bacterium]|jgi:hypothetical protein|nr:hypothetical protein [Actinomycetota bacterium]